MNTSIPMTLLLKSDKRKLVRVTIPLKYQIFIFFKHCCQKCVVLLNLLFGAEVLNTKHKKCTSQNNNFTNMCKRYCRTNKKYINTYLIYTLYSDGAGRTGSFCCLYTTLERLKAEGVVDIFITARLLRTQRPGMIATLVRSLNSSY